MNSRWIFVPTPAASEVITWTFTLGALHSSGRQYAISSYAESGAGADDWFEFGTRPLRTDAGRTRIDWLVKVDGTNGEYANASDFTSNASISSSRLVHNGTELTIDSLSLSTLSRNTVVVFRFNTSDGTNQWNALSTGDSITVGLNYS